MALGAQQEQALAGFWQGNEMLAEPAFVAHTYPEPPGFRVAAIQPDAAYFHPELAELILPYEKVRLAADPDQLLLEFCRSIYEMGGEARGPGSAPRSSARTQCNQSSPETLAMADYGTSPQFGLSITITPEAANIEAITDLAQPTARALLPAPA